MTTLTVFLAPDGPACGVLDVLTDLSAAGLVREFLWVVDADVGTDTTRLGDVAAIAVADGVSVPTSLGTVLAERDHDRRRLCVIVPVADGSVVTDAVEQRMHEVVALTGARVPTALIRVVVARPGDHTAREVLRRDGWHNVLVAPEAARGPGSPSQLLPRDAHPVELGRLAAPAVAGLVGLWTGLDASPLDTAQAPDGVRAARAFYCRVDADEVDAELRRQVLSTRAPLPEPGDHLGQAVYLPDPGGTCREMAGLWWKRHEPSLVGTRQVAQDVPVEQTTGWALLKEFIAFLWKTLRGVPYDLAEGTKIVAATFFARQVHHLVLGAGDSGLSVVVGGVDRDGRPVAVDWQALGRASGELDRRLADTELTASEPERPDLRRMWSEFADVAMTLTDAGQRTFTPPQVGPNRGVVRATTDVAPPPRADFMVSGRLHNDVGERVVVGDVLGAAVLRGRLQQFRTDPVRAEDASHTLNELAAWEGAHQHAYTVQAGHRLAAKLYEVVGELTGYLEWLRRMSGEVAPQPGGGRSRRWLMWLLTLLMVAGLATGTVLVVRETVSVLTGLIIALAPMVLWLLFVILVLWKEFREIFRDRYRRRKLLSEEQVVRANLRQAVIDAGRLAGAYEQYLVWCRVVGAVLDAPFGPPAPTAQARPDITSGLPRTTRLARAQVDQAATGEAAEVLRRDVFSVGWLGRQWAVHLSGAGRQIRSPRLTAQPAALLDLRGGVADAPLTKWADVLARSGTTAAAGEAQWEQVRASLRSPRGRRLEGDLLQSVRAIGPGPQRTVRVGEFLSSVDEAQPGPDEEFAAEHFTANGRAERRNRIDVHWPAEERIGLSRVVVLVQLSEACDPEDFVLATRGPAPDGHRYEAPPGYTHTAAVTERGAGNGYAAPAPSMPRRAVDPGSAPEAPPGFH